MMRIKYVVGLSLVSTLIVVAACSNDEGASSASSGGDDGGSPNGPSEKTSSGGSEDSGGGDASSDEEEPQPESCGTDFSSIVPSSPTIGAIRVGVHGVRNKGKRIWMQINRASGARLVSAGESLPYKYCGGFTQAPLDDTYTVEVVVDDGDGACDPTKDLILHGTVPAFVDRIATIELTYPADAASTCPTITGFNE